MMRLIRVVGLVLILSSALSAQKTVSAKTSTTASLTGKVFAITKGGDVKPALLAHVYLFSVKDDIPGTITKLLEIHRKYETTIAEIVDDYPEAAADPTFAKSLADQTSCRKTLRDIDEMIADFDKYDRHLNPTYATETDEIGAFSITKVAPGDYMIVTHGQAGRNDVLWIESVTFARGEKKTVKLSSVAEACQRE